MIVTVLWEDQRGAQVKGFGPHELLISCLVDELGHPRDSVARAVECHPKKGHGKVLRALRLDFPKLKRLGPVLAVVDRDKIKDLLSQPVTDCMSGISKRFREAAPGDYELIFMIDNVETLIVSACRALGESEPTRKPTPDERDRILAKAVWGERAHRARIRSTCPSFDRVVRRILAHLEQARS